MSANDVIRDLLIDNRGPWKNYERGTMENCRDLFAAVADQIVADVVGIHPAACDGVSADYEHNADYTRIEIRFDVPATHTAEQIATAFRKYAAIPVVVVVVEATSEFRAT